MSKNNMKIVLPTGTLQLECGVLEIMHCQLVVSTPQNALKPAFIVDSTGGPASMDINETINVAERDAELKSMAERLGISIEEFIKAVGDEGTDTQTACPKDNASTKVLLTNMCAENVKINFTIQGPRLIKTKNSEEVCCHGFSSVAAVSGGLLFNGATMVTKKLELGETVEVVVGDTIQINEDVVVKFKQVDNQKTIDKNTSDSFANDEGDWLI